MTSLARRELIYWLLRSPSQTCHAKPKTQNQQAPDATSFFPVGGMPTVSSLAWKTSLPPKSQDAVAFAVDYERGALHMIDRGDIRQAIDRCSNICLHCRALVMVSSSIRLTARLQNSKKRAGVREIDVWAESPRLSPLWLHHRLPVMGLLIITVITPLPTKPSVWQNARELKLANAAITDMQMRQRDVAAPDAKYTKELADAKATDVGGMMLLVVVGCTSAVCQPREATTASGVDNAASRLADTAERDYFPHPQRGWSLCKTTGRNPEVY